MARTSAARSRDASDAPPEADRGAYAAVLRAAKYRASPSSPYPLYVVVLDTDGREKELPGVRPGTYVSDALAALLRGGTRHSRRASHVIAVTGGHNVTVGASISVLCAAVAELQAHPALHDLASDDPNFAPIFVAFAWRGMPRTFFKLSSPVARAKLVRDCERSKPEVGEAVAAAQHALSRKNSNGAELSTVVQRIYAVDGGTPPPKARRQQVLTRFDRGFGDSRIAYVLGPLETAIISMYEERARAVGRTCQRIFQKFQLASPQLKVCLISSSLGAHVFGQALVPSAAPSLPDSSYGLLRKVHCAMFVHGAAGRDQFTGFGIYGRARAAVAGAAMAVTTSSNKVLNVYDMYHKGGLIGKVGMEDGISIQPNQVDDKTGLDMKDRNMWLVAEIDETDAANSGSCWFSSSVARLFWIAVGSEVDADEYTSDFMDPASIDLMLESSLSESRTKRPLASRSWRVARWRSICYHSLDDH